MSKANAKKERFPWLLLLLFLATVGVFWVLPYYRGVPPVKVDFEPSTSPPAPSP